jgi:DNA-binding transcriptional ArsR family regulator
VGRPIYEVKAEFFKTLAHPARIRVLEVLSDGELPVNEMLPLVGIEPSHLSQQLAVLRRAGLVRSRRDGSSVIYDVVDRRLFRLLDAAKGILTSSLIESQDLLRDLEQIEYGEKKQPKRRK